jgi:hypothetical protein
MPWSDASAPDGPARETHTDRRVAQQSRTARTAEATSIGEGGIVVKGGRIVAEYPSGRGAAIFGPLFREDTGEPYGHGFLVQADDDAQGRDVFIAKYFNGRRLVYIGNDPGEDNAGSADVFVSNSVRTGLHSQGEEMRIQAHHGGPVRIYGGGTGTGASSVTIATFEGGLLKLQTADNGDIEVLSDDRIWFFADGDIDADANGHIRLTADGTAAIGGGAGVFLQPESGAGVANVRMDTTTGRITYVPSTVRAKRDIQDLTVNIDTVLQLRPRTWLPGPGRRHCPEWLHASHTDPEQCCDGKTVEPPADAPREVGFVAEELDELGLGDFVEYDTEGLPASIRYDRLTAALVPLLQRQQGQLDALADKLEQLTARVTGEEHAPDTDTRRQ